jgi:hypothetical protein
MLLVHTTSDKDAFSHSKANGWMQTHRHADKQARRHTDTQAHRHEGTGTQARRHTGTKTHRHTGTKAQAHRHANTQARRHAGTQARSQMVQPNGTFKRPPPVTTFCITRFTASCENSANICRCASGTARALVHGVNCVEVLWVV